jgi:hypothetical protein
MRALLWTVVILGLWSSTCASEDPASLSAAAAQPPSAAGTSGQLPDVIALRAYDQTPIPCGPAQCVQTREPNFSVPRVCCVDQMQGLCGTRASNNECVGAADTSQAANCPKSMIFGMILNGCCTADGQCGADSTSVGLGCVDLSDMNFRNLADNPPQPRPCASAGTE